MPPSPWPGQQDPSLRAVALLQLTKEFNSAGDRRIRKFVFGYPIIGEINQTGVSPRDVAKRPPPPIDDIWRNNIDRFKTRARASGVLNAQMWDEAGAQVDKGRLAEPVPIGPTGNVAPYEKNGVLLAFR